jgi:ABC-2 type transport system permease protein
MSVTEFTPLDTYRPELGRPIKGPQALTGDWRRFWSLTFNIAKTNWKMRFFGSFLGYVWQFVRPLLLFGVLYVFFTKVANVNKLPPHPPLSLRRAQHDYGVQLLGAIIIFTYLQEATTGAVRSVVDSEQLVRKIEFPRMVIPLAQVLLATFNLCGNLIVVLIFALISGVTPMVSWLEVPLCVLFVAVFATGLAMLLSTAFVYFRDIQPIWEVAMQTLFYASPVIISMVTVGEHLPLGGTLMHIYMCNPMAVALQQFKHAFVTHWTYGASYYAGGWAYLAIPLALVAGVFALGFFVFNRTAPYVADNI